MTIIQAQRLGEPGTEILELLKDICLTVNGKQDGIFSEEDRDEAKAEYINDCVEMITEELTKLSYYEA